MKRTLFILALMFLIAIPVAMAQTDDPKTATPPNQAGAGLAPQGPGCQGKGMGMGMCSGKQPMGGQGLMECMKDLNLTDDQKAKMEEINFTNRNAMIDLRAGMEKARLKMHHEMMADTPDKAKILAASKEINTIQGQIEDAQINHFFAVRGILTADQLKKMKECKGDRLMGPCGHGRPGARGGGHWFGQMDDENQMENNMPGMQPPDDDSRIE